jgi:hypothetical protein
MNRFSAGLKSSSPLLKQGAPTRFGLDDIGGSFSGSHAGAKRLEDFAWLMRFSVLFGQACRKSDQLRG